MSRTAAAISLECSKPHGAGAVASRFHQAGQPTPEPDRHGSWRWDLVHAWIPFRWRRGGPRDDLDAGPAPRARRSDGGPDGDRPLPGDPALGQGGFGRVYLARDDELDRSVAIKVPNPERVAGPEDVEAYLAEARTLAKLDHPHIVPVYDVGRTDDGLCYVVSKYVEGSDLAERMRQGRLDVAGIGGAGGDRRRGAAPRPHPGPGPPRRQARQHPARRGRAAVRGRLRAGAEGRGLRQGRPARPARPPT